MSTMKALDGNPGFEPQAEKLGVEICPRKVYPIKVKMYTLYNTLMVFTIEYIKWNCDQDKRRPLRWSTLEK